MKGTEQDRRIQQPKVETIDLNGSSDSELLGLSEKHSLGLNSGEMIQLKNYFTKLGRNPTDIELQAMAQAWSEHCCYKSSKFYLKKYLSNLRADYVELAMEDDAGVVSLGDDLVYVLKMESHNHPSAVEPYGGAATGVGGIIRDVLCMGAQPVALVDSLSFGMPDGPRNGPLSQKFLLNRIVAGIRDYGNRLGIPTVAGSVDFDESYSFNPLVNAGCVGVARKSDIVRSRISEVGDVLVLAGGRTGRDGIHGVTFASRALDIDQKENKRAVQLGNPIVEEPLIHAVLELVSQKLVDGMKDLGGGGLSSSVGEMCYSGGTGAVIDIDNVPLKEPNMAPWEIWVSESQERMLLAVKEENLEKVNSVFDSWDIEHAEIGRVEEGDHLRIRYGKEEIFNLSLPFLTSGPVYSRFYLIPEEKEIVKTFPAEPRDYNETLRKMLSSCHLSSRSPIVRQYDFTVRGNTIVRPFNGISGEQTHSDAAVVKASEESSIGISITSGSNPRIASLSPYHGTLNIMAEAMRNTISSGAKAHSVVDCLNFGNPEDPVIMGQFVESTRAIGDFCSYFGLPVVAGNVSLYNGSGGKEIKPTPTIMMVGVIKDVGSTVNSSFRKKGNSIYLVGRDSTSLDGSVYLALAGEEGGSIESVDMEELKSLVEKFVLASELRILESVHDISQGGIAQALCEMSFGNMVGADISLSGIQNDRPAAKLFSELGNRFLVEVAESNEEEFRKIFGDSRILRIGNTAGDRMRIENLGITLVDQDLTELAALWNSALSGFM